MQIPFGGGCACGAIRYEVTGEPVLAVNCHCRDCQRFSGGGHSTGMFVPDSAFRFTKGEPKYHVMTAESGTRVKRGFCVECGCPVVARGAFPVFIVYAASLDDPSGHRPTVDVWTASAHAWDVMDPALPKYPKGMA